MNIMITLKLVAEINTNLKKLSLRNIITLEEGMDIEEKIFIALAGPLAAVTENTIDQMFKI